MSCLFSLKATFFEKFSLCTGSSPYLILDLKAFSGVRPPCLSRDRRYSPCGGLQGLTWTGLSTCFSSLFPILSGLSCIGFLIYWLLALPPATGPSKLLIVPLKQSPSPGHFFFVQEEVRCPLRGGRWRFGEK